MYGWWFHWHGVEPRAVARAPIALRALATFHPSGYVREEATRSLAGEEEALPYILLRLNDWVEPVATAAQHAVEACLARASGEAVVRCLPIVERLRSVRRRALQAVVDSVERSVIRPSARPALREALASAPPAVRRTCVLYAARLPPGEAVPLLVPLTTDRDPVVASRATQTLARALPVPALRETFAPLLHSRIGRVRLLALGALLASGSDDLSTACSDGHCSTPRLRFASWHVMSSGAGAPPISSRPTRRRCARRTPQSWSPRYAAYASAAPRWMRLWRCTS